MDYSPVILGFTLYALYVILPLVPSVIIYKSFPNTTVGATGLLGNLKINATGAFAAYMITVILGHFIIKQNFDLITDLTSTNWTITSKLTFVDTNGVQKMDVTDEDVRNKLEIKTTPDYTVKNLSRVVFIACVKGNLPKVTFSYPGYKMQTVDLEVDEIKSKDYSERTLDIGVVKLTSIKQEYKPEKFASDTNSGNPSADGPPALGTTDPSN